MSANRQLYQLINDKQLSECTPYNGELLCNGPLHWLTSQVNNCVWEVFNGLPSPKCTFRREAIHDSWHNLGLNSWIFTSKHAQHLIFTCGEKNYRETIHDSGMINLGNCSIRGPRVEINANNNYNGHELEILIPYNDEFSEISSNKFMYVTNFTTSDIDSMKRELEIVKNSELPFTHHNIHHYISNYTTLILLIILFILVSRKINLFKRPIKIPSVAGENVSVSNTDNN